MLVSQLAGLEAPRPVALRLTRSVHPCPAPEPEHVLERDHRKPGPRGERELDQLPRLLLREVAAQRVGVVGRGVDDLVLPVVLEPMRVRLRPLESPEEYHHPGKAEPVA